MFDEASTISPGAVSHTTCGPVSMEIQPNVVVIEDDNDLPGSATTQ